MGNQTSLFYKSDGIDDAEPPSKLTLEADDPIFNALEINPLTDINTDSSGSKSNLYKKKIGDLFNKLKTNFEMYMLYDNYDKKNNVLVSDLKKKVANQDKELKQLIEDRDKLKTVLNYDDDKTTDFKTTTKHLSGTNIFLFIVFIILICIIIYRIITYPLIMLEDENNAVLDKLLSLNNSQLKKYTKDELKLLNSIVDKKITDIDSRL